MIPLKSLNETTETYRLSGYFRVDLIFAKFAKMAYSP